jgi:hypothetical protein
MADLHHPSLAAPMSELHVVLPSGETFGVGSGTHRFEGEPVEPSIAVAAD